MQFFQKLFTLFALLCITVYAQAQTPQETDRCSALPAFSAKRTADTSFGAVAGSQNVKVASFQVLAGKNEAVITSAFVLKARISPSLQVQNMVVKVTGVTQNFVVSIPQDQGIYTFTPPRGAIRISACDSVTVDVFIDILFGTSVNGMYQPIELVGAIAYGEQSQQNKTLVHTSTGQTVSTTNSIFGQIVDVFTNGSAHLSSAFTSTVGNSGQVVRLGGWKLTASNTEDVRADVFLLTFYVSSKEPCPGVSSVRLIARVGNQTAEAFGTPLALNGTSLYSIIGFPNGGIVVPRNTQASFEAYGVLSDCRVSTIMTEISNPWDVRLFGMNSQVQIFPSGNFPSSGGIVDVVR